MKYKKQIILIFIFLFFWSLYLVTNKINENRQAHKLETRLDSIIRFNPIFSAFYTLYFFEVLIIFFIFFKKEKTLRNIVLMLVISTIIHNIIFLTYPAAIDRPNIINQNFFNKLTLFYYNIDKPYNAFPSMHISLITITFLSLFFYWNKKYSLILLPLYLLTAISTVYIKQHYVIDVIAGILLGVLIFQIFKIKNKLSSSGFFLFLLNFIL